MRRYTDDDRAKVVAFAKAQVGKPYRFKGVGPKAFDCSGLTLAAWLQAGLTLPHNAGAQAEVLDAVPFTPANRAKLLPGDIVFYYGSVAEPVSVTHCAMYVERKSGLRQVVAAVDDAHGVMEHWIAWALQPCGFGYVGHS